MRALDLTGERGPLALASSTPMALIIRCLQHFGLLDRFAAIHSAEHEPFGKPHPGVFLSAAASLDVAPDECLVFEDSAAGVLAAKSGTMTVVAVPTPDDLYRPEFALADLVLVSLEELTARVARRTLRLEVFHESAGEVVGVCSGRILVHREPPRGAIELYAPRAARNPFRGRAARNPSLWRALRFAA